MNLKTHNAYQEIHIDEHFTWVVNILSLNGDLLEAATGTAVDRSDATSKAIDFVNSVEGKYKRGVE